jgi:hypothetical protein
MQAPEMQSISHKTCTEENASGTLVYTTWRSVDLRK